MEGGDPADDAELAWRRLSSVLVWGQLAAMVAVPPLLFLADRSERLWAYLAVGVVVVIEVAQALVARAAQRRIPGFSRGELYAARPLSRRDRQIVVAQLTGYPICAALLVVVVGSSTSVGEPAAAVLVAAWIAPGVLSVYRVWRHNSWSAVSRLPLRARSRP
jgi:hypothetical protein